MDDLISRQRVSDLFDAWEAAELDHHIPKILRDRLKAIPSVQPNLQPTCNNLATDTISRQAAIDAIKTSRYLVDAMEKIIRLPSAQSEEVTPHRNYKYLSDYWCECGNHLGKKGSVTFCSDCGRKVKWDE